MFTSLRNGSFRLETNTVYPALAYLFLVRSMHRIPSLMMFFLAASGCAMPEVIDGTAGTSSICELHHVQMTRARVSLHTSGIASPYHDYSRCPHAKRPIHTGCIGLPFGSYGYIWVCPECQRACKP
jgi:hypothetical protein